jgi:two-component system, OmpR family, sensor histidine kinase ChvG
MTVEAAQPVEPPAIVRWGRRAWRQSMALFARHGLYYNFRSIKSRIIAINVIGVCVLVAGMLLFNDTRDALINARIKSLEVEADIIARAIASNSTDAVDPVQVSNDPLLAMQMQASGDEFPAQPFSINPERSAQLLRQLIEPTKTHGFIFSADGSPIVDSNKIYTRGQIIRYQTQTRAAEEERENPFYRWWLKVENLFRWETLPEYRGNGPRDGRLYAEVKAALEGGATMRMVRMNDLGETILAVAAPIQRGKQPVLGALLLTTPGGELDGIIARERFEMVRVGGFVLGVMAVFSLLMAGTIANPMRRLATAAESVRRNIRKRAEMPNFAHRLDEIGHLSSAFCDMTSALYRRLDAIESFAADVAHELKNPLTSLRSAADTLALVKREEDRERLVQIIQHDVKRLNRLITDISDASRLDSELQRETRQPVNIAKVLDGICGIVNDIHREGTPQIELKVEGMPRGAAVGGHPMFTIYGHEGRLSQVVNNLLDNAISFSPPGGRILVTCRHLAKSREVEVLVEDEGRGIPPENLERVFERFYTDRPEHEEFGQNSGLGLNISRQIVEAHSGKIWAENRTDAAAKTEDGEPKIIGARFVIRLPVLS